jgi:hypothetical protein
MWMFGCAVAAQQVNYVRAWRLADWYAAVEQHQPRRDDAGLAQARRLTYAELDHMRFALPAVAALMRDPDATSFFYAPPRGLEGRQMPPVLFHPSDLETFRDVAARAVRRGDFNQLLKRGALLHTDVAMLASDGTREGNADRDAGVTVRFFDGSPLGLEQTGSHWQVARQLLDMVSPDLRSRTPNPSRDAGVRSWYQATMAALLAQRNAHMAHSARGVELFPQDPDILFLAAALHEFVASAGVQDVVRTARMPIGTSLGIQPSRDELRQAESLFRRALAADANHLEARLRLGRVLAQLGRPPDAARELRSVVAATRDPLLLFYGELFLGEVNESLGDLEGAQRSYERARTLYPTAQSARLALSQLAERSGDRRGSLDHVAAAAAAGDKADDPWWEYHAVAARGVPARLARMYAALSEGSSR